MSRCNLNGTRIKGTTRGRDILSLSLEREDLALFVRNKLSREERLILMLHYAEQLPFDEIAGVMSMPQNRIKSMHDKLVTRLRKALHGSRPRGKHLQAATAGS